MMKLNETLLALIIYIQSSKQYYISKIILNFSGDVPPDHDWYMPTRDDFFAVPEDIFAKAGISACTANFDMMLSFEVTDEMLDAQPDELGKFTVGFYEKRNNNQEPKVSIAPKKGAYDDHRPWVNNCVEDSFG